MHAEKLLVSIATAFTGTTEKFEMRALKISSLKVLQLSTSIIPLLSLIGPKTKLKEKGISCYPIFNNIILTLFIT